MNKRHLIQLSLLIIALFFINDTTALLSDKLSNRPMSGTLNPETFFSGGHSDNIARALSRLFSASIQATEGPVTLLRLSRITVQIARDDPRVAMVTKDIPNGPQYGQVFFVSGKYVLVFYNPNNEKQSFPVSLFDDVWHMPINKWASAKLLVLNEENFSKENRTVDQAIAAAVKNLSNIGVPCVLAGQELAKLDDAMIAGYISAFCVVQNKRTALKLLLSRLNNENIKLFDSVFNPRKRLADRYNEGKNPLKLVQIRGGRGSSHITRAWKGLALEKLVSLSIIPGAIDDGGSWADFAYYMGSTGMPDIGKSTVDMGQNKLACDFASMRLILNKDKVQPSEAITTLNNIIQGFQGMPYDTANEDAKRIVVGFRLLAKDKQQTAFNTIKKFYELLTTEWSRKKHYIDVRSVAIRSMMLIGGYQLEGSWQVSADMFGNFVDSVGTVALPTEERMHGLAILEDGTVLPTENAINELPYKNEYVYFTVGPDSFADPKFLLSLFLKVYNREPSEEEMALLESLRTENYAQLSKHGTNHLIIPCDKIRVAVEFIEKYFSRNSAKPRITEQEKVISLLKEAEVITYGPTDLESNIASAVAYPDIASTIANNRQASKFFVANSRDVNKVEPDGTTAGSLLERLYRWMSGQPRWDDTPLDTQSHPVRGYVEYSLGTPEWFMNPRFSDYIPLDIRAIAQLGSVPVGLDMECQTLKGRTDIGPYNSEYTTSSDGRYNPSVIVDTVLSIHLMKEANCPLEDIDKMFFPGLFKTQKDDDTAAQNDKILTRINKKIFPSMIDAMITDMGLLKNKPVNTSDHLIKNNRRAIIIDRSLGPKAIADLQDALERLARESSHPLNELLSGLVIEFTDITELELRRVEDKKHIKKENMVIIARHSAEAALADYENISVITKVDDKNLGEGAYYPIMDIILFSLMRVGELKFTKDDLVDFYISIPNIKKYSYPDIEKLCWDKLSSSIKKTVLLELGLPKAEEITSSVDIYLRIAKHIKSAA